MESPKSIKSSSQEEEDVVEDLPEHQPFDNSYTMRTEIEGMNRSVFKSKSGKKKPSSSKKQTSSQSKLSPLKKASSKSKMNQSVMLFHHTPKQEVDDVLDRINKTSSKKSKLRHKNSSKAKKNSDLIDDFDNDMQMFEEKAMRSDFHSTLKTLNLKSPEKLAKSPKKSSPSKKKTKVAKEHETLQDTPRQSTAIEAKLRDIEILNHVVTGSKILTKIQNN